MRTFKAADFPANTFIDSDPAWTVAVGVQFLRSNGTTWNKANTSGNSFNLTLETSGVETIQRIEAVASSTLGGLVVMGSNTSGFTGYMIAATSATNWRLQRYVAGAASGTLGNYAATDTATQKCRLECEIVAGDPVLKVFADGVQIGATYTDTSVNKLTTGQRGVGTTNVSAATPYLGTEIVTNYAVAATAFDLSGPAAGNAGIPSASIVVTPNGLPTSGTTVNFSDGGAGGTFTPSSLIFTDEQAQVVTYTASSPGSKTISMTNSGGYTDGTPLSYSAVAQPVIPPGVIFPGAGWTGAAGSAGNVPVDPTRVTAKAALRISTPPKQAFSGPFRVGVQAGALGDLEKVVFRLEGLENEVTEETIETITDRFGRTIKMPSYSIVLDHASFSTNGSADLYVKAVPLNPLMQARWEGPFRFFRAASVFSDSVAVAPSQPESAGVSYQTIEAALNYHRTNASARPLTEIVEDGDYLYGSPLVYNLEAWSTIKIADGVNATIVGPPQPAGAASIDLEFTHSNTRFQNCTFDMEWMKAFYVNATHRDIWLDQCEIFDTLGQFGLRDGTPNVEGTLITSPQAVLARTYGWATENYLHDVRGGLSNINLVRNPKWPGCAGDIVSNVACTVGGEYSKVDTGLFRDFTDALVISYSGSGVPTWETVPSGSIATQMVSLILKVDGVVVPGGTLNITSYGDMFLPSDAAEAINGLTDFSCVVPPGGNIKSIKYLTRNATQFGAQANGVFTGGVATLYTAIDVHQDWSQLVNTLAPIIENIIAVGGMVIESTGLQGILGTDNASQDILYRNCTIYITGEVNPPVTQLGKNKKHFMMQNCSFPTQQVTMKASGVFDEYCAFDNCVFQSVGVEGGSTIPADLSDHCHFITGTVPTWADNATSGGDVDSLWEDTVDFTPIGALVTNSAPPVCKYDAYGNLRDPLASALGSVAAPSEYAGSIVIGPMNVGKAGGPQHAFSLTINPA